MTKVARGLLRRNHRICLPKRLTRLVVAGLLMWNITGGTDLHRAAAQSNSNAEASMSKGHAISSSARTTADALFGDRCAVCHGANGDGNGPGAANLNPKPVDFRDRKWQRKVTDEKITKAIIYGGPAVGLSASMAANPDLETQPQVVAALVEHIRSLARSQRN